MPYLQTENVLEFHRSLVLNQLGHIFCEHIEYFDVLRNAFRIGLCKLCQSVSHGNKNSFDIHTGLQFGASLQKVFQSLWSEIWMTEREGGGEKGNQEMGKNEHEHDTHRGILG